MPADIVIRGGTVVDGTRRAGPRRRRGDRRRSDPGDRRRTCSGERELDASGCVVAPGFIDIHTHYDAQVFWDPALRPSSYQGVTTVVAGQLRLHHRAHPARAPRRDRAHARERRGHGRRVADRGHRVGLPDLPRVPGAGPQPRHRDQLHRVRRAQLGTALRDGGRGLRACGHARRDRRDVPPRHRGDRGRCGRVLHQLRLHAPRHGREARARAASPSATRSARCSSPAGRTGKGVVLATAGEQCTYADMYEWQPRIGRPFTYPLFALADGRHHPQLAAARGVRGQRGAGLAAGHPAAAHHAVHDGQPVQPEREHGVRRADGPGPRRAHRRVPRSRTGGPGPPPTSSRSRCGRAGRRARSPSRSGSPSWRAGGSTSWRASAAAVRST